MADEETEIQAENAEERPDWLPSNFSKPEDLAKSYTHSVSKITEQGQELAALKAQITEIQAAQTQQTNQSTNDDLQAQIWEAFESGDGRAAAGAAAYLANLAVEKAMAEYKPPASERPSHETALVADYAERQVAQEFSDWPDFKAKVGEAIAANPRLSKALEGETNPETIAGHLRDAYKLAKFDAGQSSTSETTTALDELNRQVKNAAQTMTGTNSSEAPESYFDQVKAAKSGIPSFRL